MDYYFWVKAAHIAVVMIFIGGMILNGFLFRYLEPGSPQTSKLAAAARFWNGPITGNALAAVWVFGLTLAYMGNWFTDVWLMIKMALAFILSGIHGAQSAAFRRMQQSPGQPVSAFFRNSSAITIIFMIFIVVLVATKPF